MSVTNPGWQRCLQQLREAPADSFDHRFGDALAAADEDKAFGLLVDVITEDPYGTHEYEVATHMLRHFTEVSA
ncbi:hypothetical protein ACIBQ0_16905 [Nocardia nova]|uniref:hypothetical protein n=1 Tax=Nocardia nova TaxID=37330 RepID=UPI0027395072|nr:hypothetical protein [Nocardia nova]